MIGGNFLMMVAGFWLLLTPPVFSQRNYPPITGIISFNELVKRAIEKKITWKNPDGSEEEMKMIEMAIPFDQSMENRTREFMRAVYGRDSIWLNPKMIVFHAMGDGDLKTSLEISSFLHSEIPGS